MIRLALVSCCLFTVAGQADFAAGRCERIARTYSGLNAKTTACTAGETISVDLATCRASTSACEATDLRAIDRFLDCVKQLPACEAGGLSDWRAQYEACGAGVQLSSGCSL
jgi:hypothetical protein